VTVRDLEALSCAKRLRVTCALQCGAAQKCLSQSSSGRWVPWHNLGCEEEYLCVEQWSCPCFGSCDVLWNVISLRCPSLVWNLETNSGIVREGALGKADCHRITESQNSRGWKGPLWVI